MTYILFFVLKILMQDPEAGDTYGQFIVYQLPWLIGSLGTMSLDFTVSFYLESALM